MTRYPIPLSRGISADRVTRRIINHDTCFLAVGERLDGGTGLWPPGARLVQANDIALHYVVGRSTAADVNAMSDIGRNDIAGLTVGRNRPANGGFCRILDTHPGLTISQRFGAIRFQADVITLNGCGLRCTSSDQDAMRAITGNDVAHTCGGPADCGLGGPGNENTDSSVTPVILSIEPHADVVTLDLGQAAVALDLDAFLAITGYHVAQCRLIATDHVAGRTDKIAA